MILRVPSEKHGFRFLIFANERETRKIERILKRKARLSRADLEKIVPPNRIYEEYDHQHYDYVLRCDFCPICGEQRWLKYVLDEDV